MSNGNELFRRLLSGITMSELQNLVNIREEANRPIAAPRRMLEEANRHIPAPRRRMPIPTPRRNVQQLIQQFEANPIHNIGLFQPPEQRNNNQYRPLGPK